MRRRRASRIVAALAFSRRPPCPPAGWRCRSFSCSWLGAPALAQAPTGCDADLATRVVPLPIYSTLPNEGNTFGLMPVFLRVCDRTQRTQSIIAPSITWNDVIQWTGSFRWYYFPSDTESFTLVASLSTRIDSGLLLVWQDLPLENGRSTTEITARFQRSAFYRFFGIGPQTRAEDESSYTRVRALVEARRGINLGGTWNLGAVRLSPPRPGPAAGSPRAAHQPARVPRHARHGGVHHRGAGAGHPLRYPTARRLFGARACSRRRWRAWWRAFRIRRHTCTGGWRRARSGASRDRWEGPRAPSGAGSPRRARRSICRARWGAPSYLRGFTEDRFIDQAAWTVEIEQRVRLLQTRIYGVLADWRIDPFVAVGQVYGGAERNPFSHPQITGGLGFRAFVHPNVLGRVDVASGGEGIKVYVESGLPLLNHRAQRRQAPRAKAAPRARARTTPWSPACGRAAAGAPPAGAARARGRAGRARRRPPAISAVRPSSASVSARRLCGGASSCQSEVAPSISDQAQRSGIRAPRAAALAGTRARPARPREGSPSARRGRAP